MCALRNVKEELVGGLDVQDMKDLQSLDGLEGIPYIRRMDMGYALMLADNPNLVSAMGLSHSHFGKSSSFIVFNNTQLKCTPAIWPVIDSAGHTIPHGTCTPTPLPPSPPSPPPAPSTPPTPAAYPTPIAPPPTPVLTPPPKTNTIQLVLVSVMAFAFAMIAAGVFVSTRMKTIKKTQQADGDSLSEELKDPLNPLDSISEERAYERDGPTFYPNGDAKRNASSTTSGADREISFRDIVLGDGVGQGSYGKVFKGVWRGNTVAVKLLGGCDFSVGNQRMSQRMSREVAPKQFKLFEREVSILARVRHHNIVSFLGCSRGVEAGMMVMGIVMEFMSGGDLSLVIKELSKIRAGGSGGSTPTHGSSSNGEEWAAKNALDEGAAEAVVDKKQQQQQEQQQQQQQQQEQDHFGLLEWKRAATGVVIPLATQIAGGLRYLHDSGILHRDLKPNNVLVTADWTQAKITDFGLSKMMTDPEVISLGKGLGAGAADKSVSVFGNAYYAAPEVLLGETSATNASSIDVYAFALIMWQLFTGHHYDLDGDLVVVLLKIVHDDWRPALPAHMPAKLRSLLTRCWHRSPDLRPTCREIEAELQGCLLVKKGHGQRA
jgi:serine/threonine protein kinase